jgi:hypothetical protein
MATAQAGADWGWHKQLALYVVGLGRLVHGSDGLHGLEDDPCDVFFLFFLFFSPFLALYY